MTDADEASTLRQKLGEALETVTELEAEVAALRRARMTALPGPNVNLAEAVFNAYSDCPPNDARGYWKDLPEHVRRKWTAAADAARLFVLSDTHDEELR